MVSEYSTGNTNYVSTRHVSRIGLESVNRVCAVATVGPVQDLTISLRCENTSLAQGLEIYIYFWLIELCG